ncbi:MAG: hypothetical protein HOI98_09545, partial [Rhodospirillaceae bacterium]|nr:hypothetical protein [Rhodospirillaceae bacterium]
ATVSETANTDNISAHNAAAKIGENLGDGVVGKVKYNIASGRLTFNGQSLGGSDQKELARQCASVLRRGR